MFAGIIKFVLGGASWIGNNITLVICCLALLLSVSAGWYARSVLCDLSEAKRERLMQEKVNQMINDANRESKEAEKERNKHNGLRREVTGRIANAKTNYGCHLDDDGMHTINFTPRATREPNG